MTYQPIDKPTEPGHYWCYSSYTHEFYAERVYEDQGELRTDTCRVSDSTDQWYGPAIQPPQSAHDTRQIALPGAVIPELPTTKEEPPETLP